MGTLLARAPARLAVGESLRALIAPHAGYAYSGLTAAHAFRQVSEQSFQRVVVLGPSHFARFAGASLPACDAYATPLGEVPVAPLARSLAGQGPFVSEPRCPVQRPPWGRPVPSGAATPDTWEHAIEVELPFLQQALGAVDLLPVIYGEVKPVEVAQRLDPLLDERTLLVVSTDLSHYHPYREARRLDQSCVDAICALDEERMAHEEACGRGPVLTLLRLAKQRSWQARLLDLRNSGDTAGDRAQVVGYAAIAFFAGGGRLAASDRVFLLGLARRGIEQACSGGASPEVSEAEVPPACRERRACFVTLHLNGRLRGCIGGLVASQPLFREVMRNARDAALRDTRFAPVTEDEVPQLRLEISVLSTPEPVVFANPVELLGKLRPGRDGVVLRIGSQQATFLPQVWRQLPDKVEFLRQLARKAGADPAAWRGPEARVQTYGVESFAEAD